MAAEGGNIVRFTYTGEDGEIIPHDATHVFVYAKIVLAYAFYRHASIVEVICDDKVETIERLAFQKCPRLRRVIMRGVKIAEECAFHNCEALTDVECDKLEIVGYLAFHYCRSLRSIDLQSARIVKSKAFCDCRALKDAKFSKKLERFEEKAFTLCRSLERITIPLKDGLITAENIFNWCTNLKHVDLVERAELHKIITAFYMEEWRNEMCQEITSINQILPNAPAGGFNDVGEKAQVVRRWIRSVLDKMIRYRAEHQRILDVAATTLELGLPRDLVMDNVLSFLELPPNTFGVEDREDAQNEDDMQRQG